MLNVRRRVPLSVELSGGATSADDTDSNASPLASPLPAPPALTVSGFVSLAGNGTTGSGAASNAALSGRGRLDDLQHSSLAMNALSLLACAEAASARTKTMGSRLDPVAAPLPSLTPKPQAAAVQDLSAAQEEWRGKSADELQQIAKAKGVQVPPKASKELSQTLLALKGGFGPAGKRVAVQNVREWVNNADCVLREVGLLAEGGTSLMDLLNARIESAKCSGKKRARAGQPQQQLQLQRPQQQQSSAMPLPFAPGINNNNNIQADKSAMDTVTAVTAMCNLRHQQLLSTIEACGLPSSLIASSMPQPPPPMQPAAKKRVFLPNMDGAATF